MAALQYAARTLGGHALRQARAPAVSPALEEQQRRLFPRLIHNEHPRGKPVAGCQDEKLYWKIQSMKEELYDLVAEADRKNIILGRVGRQNRELLQHLSVQVEARLNDPDWCYFRLLKRRDGFLEFGLASTLAYMLITRHSARESDPKPERATVEKEDQ